MDAALHAWANFYVIVGSSAGALTGLQFIVITLVAQSAIESSLATIDTFATPTIVHFCAVLLVSAIMSAPWQSFGAVGSAITGAGMFGLVYTIIVIRRARRVTGYKPVLEDWIWHIVLPLLGYAAVLASGLALWATHLPALFYIAAAQVLLLFIGIHNSWDTVTFLTVNSLNSSASAPKTPGKKPGNRRR